jgi:hypothetical protein
VARSAVALSLLYLGRIGQLSTWAYFYARALLVWGLQGFHRIVDNDEIDLAAIKASLTRFMCRLWAISFESQGLARPLSHAEPSALAIHVTETFPRARAAPRLHVLAQLLPNPPPPPQSDAAPTKLRRRRAPRDSVQFSIARLPPPQWRRPQLVGLAGARLQQHLRTVGMCLAPKPLLQISLQMLAPRLLPRRNESTAEAKSDGIDGNPSLRRSRELELET